MCSKLLGGLRIVLALGMLFFGVMKLSATPEDVAFVGGAAHLMGLTFLSVVTWFWIATIAELLAAVLLFSGCRSCTKWGALLTLIVMVFALNTLGWTSQETMLPWVFVIIAVTLLVWGPGARCFYSLCKTSCSGSCGSCAAPDAQKMQQEQQHHQQQ